MAVPVPGFLEVSKLIELAKEQGCEHKIAKIQIVTPWGIKPISYLHNPKTGGTFDISDLSPGESVGPSTVRSAERRLGIKLLD